MADSTVTDLLLEWRKGNREAGRDLIARMQPELRRIAAIHMSRERPGHTLQPTALVNELFLRLMGAEQSLGRTAPISSQSPPSSFGEFWLIPLANAAPKNAAEEVGRPPSTKNRRARPNSRTRSSTCIMHSSNSRNSIHAPLKWSNCAFSVG